LGFAIGDATGHGMAAALLVSMAHSCLHATTRKGASVEEVMAAMNAMVCSVGARERLMRMTFAYSIINPRERYLQFANAGHLPPYHYAAATDTLKAIEHGAFPLGILQNIDYPTQIVPLAPGDRLIYYSDGFIEAFNDAEELYGFERFEASIRQHIREPVETMLEMMLANVRSYCGDVPPVDDMTLVIITL
jgi:sigma-B regulation protein RsbU (phosphoserine phosphatase)